MNVTRYEFLLQAGFFPVIQKQMNTRIDLKTTAEAEFNSRLFEKLDMQDEEFREKEFYNCNFVQCNFQRANLSHAVFKDCKFVKCDLSMAKIENTVFQDLLIEQSKMVGVDWTIAGLHRKSKLNNRISIVGSDISFSFFTNCNLNGAIFTECKAKEVDFSEADLVYAKLLGCDFDGATFYKTNLTNADLTYATNYRINICDNKVTNAKFSFPEVLNLLKPQHIVIHDFDRDCS